MPRYEIVAHLASDVECGTAEEAASLVGHQLRAATGGAIVLHHLAVWRQEPPAASPLPPALRRQLTDFFVAVERQAARAEAAFRTRVGEILGEPTAPAGAGRYAAPPPSGREPISPDLAARPRPDVGG